MYVFCFGFFQFSRSAWLRVVFRPSIMSVKSHHFRILHVFEMILINEFLCKRLHVCRKLCDSKARLNSNYLQNALYDSKFENHFNSICNFWWMYEISANLTIMWIVIFDLRLFGVNFRREQRVTGTVVFTLVGCTVFLGKFLKVSMAELIEIPSLQNDSFLITLTKLEPPSQLNI